MMYYLKSDAIGPFSAILYARKGEPVVLVADYDDMAIVESGNGTRFSLKKKALSEEFIQPDMTRAAEVESVRNGKSKKVRTLSKSLF